MSLEQDRLVELIVKKFHADVRSLDPEEDLFGTLGINSLQALDLLYELEVEFGVEIPDTKLHQIKTFRNLLEAIRH